MVKRTSMDNASCPIARSLDTIGDWWSLLIVREAFGNVRRFNEFQKRLGLAKNILATRLRDLVAEGIFEMRPAADGSAYQEYVLTKKGRRLAVVMVALWQWGEENLFEPGEPSTMLLDRENHRPLRKLELQAEDGRTLRLSEIMLVAPELEAETGQ